MSDMKWSRKLWSVLLAALLVLPGGVLAQSSGEAPAQAKAQGKPFSQEQLDQLLAPVALYPDDLLTQLLMASTYPLEVVKANSWVKQNKDLKGDALAKALEKQEWDPSVRSLVNFPQVLQMMTDKIDWTQKIGDAFLAQQKDVMDTVQKLRKKAYDEGNLKSGKEQTVVVEKDPQTVIIIQQANPEVVYVPSYNPTVVYGGWWYPAYPPTLSTPTLPSRPPTPSDGEWLSASRGGTRGGIPTGTGGTWTSTSTGTRTSTRTSTGGSTRNSNRGGAASPVPGNGSTTPATGKASPTRTARRRSSTARGAGGRPHPARRRGDTATGEGRARRPEALTGAEQAEPAGATAQAVAGAITPSAARAAAARTGPRAIAGTRAGAEEAGLPPVPGAAAVGAAAVVGAVAEAADAAEAEAAGRMAECGSRIPCRDNIRR